MAEHSAASAESITVTYAASQALLAAPLAPHFINLLNEQLPLRNLHWRPSQSTLDAVAARAAQQGKSAHTSSSVVPGSTIRTIQTLDVALKPLTDEIRRWRGDPGYFEQPATAGLLDRPFVHLYLVVCEDSEHYRTTVRNEIRSWISSLSFFHAKQAAPPPSVGTPTLASSSRTSLGLGSFRSATPPVRSDTPPTTTTGTSSGPHTPTNQSNPSNKPPVSSVPTGPTEPEYLVVLITPPEGAGISGLAGPGAPSAEAKSGMGRFMNKSKGNVLEKARADFNTSKKEHVVQLSRLPPVPAAPLGRSGLHSMDPTIWAELLTKMREAASSTFTTTVEAQEEEIARCGVTRGQQGWDFCSYFLAKDSLARTLEAVGLKDDAIGQYEDLEIVFAQAMQTGAVAFAPVGGDDANDDSLPLLDVTKKPYADLIRRREISLFDFRCYLFARKSALLGKMGRVAAVMREAPLFISAVGRMLRGNKRLSSQWIESWIFSAALDVVEQCQAWLIQRGSQSSTSTDDQLSPAFHSNKSELLDVARRQLDRIGIEVGHLPASEPFAFAAPDSSTTSPTSTRGERDLPPLPTAQAAGLGAAVELDAKRTSSRPELRRAVESRDLFDSYYLALCERILAGWKASSRRRDALHVRTIVATLQYLRGQHQAAYDALVALTDAYAAAKFTTLEAHALAMQLECHAQLGKPRDRAWITAALAALRVAVQAPSARRSVEPDAVKWTDAAYLCEQLRGASAALEREVPISAFPLFSISLARASAQLAETEDGSLLSVHVTSLLPCAQEVQDVRVCLVTADGSTLWYTSAKTELRPGVTTVELFCPHPASGVYSVDVTQIRIARLIFQYDHAGSEATAVRVPKDGWAPTVSVALPQQIDLDQPRAVEVTIWSGRNEMEDAQLSITVGGTGTGTGGGGGGALVDLAQAQISAAAEADARAGTIDPTRTSAACVTLQSLPRDSRTCLLVPLLQLPESGVLSAALTLTYSTTGAAARHAKKRTLHVPVRLTTALPLGVNVQDFFRSACLLSRFTISAGGGGSIRLRPVTLAPETTQDDGGEGEVGQGGRYRIETGGSAREACVTPRQPATYLFRVSAPSRPASPVRAERRLRLAVHYRALQDDAVSAAVRALGRVVAAEQLAGLEEGQPGRKLLEEALVAYVRERLDLPAFSISGQVRTGALDRHWWRRERHMWGHDVLALEELLGVLQQTLDAIPGALSADEESSADDVWQKLTIPVEVPTVDYVNAVTLSVDSAPGVGVGGDSSVVVGQPVMLTVEIRTSTLWSARKAQEAEMVYDVVPDFEMWLVDGCKRGTFVPRRPKPLVLPSEDGEGDESTFRVALTIVPLRTGALPFPAVLVRPLAASSHEGDATPPSCETYTTNAAQRIQVVPANTTKAFFIPTFDSTAQKRASATQRDSWNQANPAGLDRMRTAFHSQQHHLPSHAHGGWQAHV